MCSPRSRLVISAAPPGGKGTMTCRDFEGKVCAWTVLTSALSERSNAEAIRGVISGLPPRIERMHYSCPKNSYHSAFLLSRRGMVKQVPDNPATECI